jgi:hypothetical protein
MERTHRGGQPTRAASAVAQREGRSTATMPSANGLHAPVAVGTLGRPAIRAERGHESGKALAYGDRFALGQFAGASHPHGAAPKLFGTVRRTKVLRLSGLWGVVPARAFASAGHPAHVGAASNQ